MLMRIPGRLLMGVMVVAGCWAAAGAGAQERAAEAAGGDPADATWGWSSVPLVSAELRSAGADPGGEGGQWPQDIAIDAVDGSLVIFATDVGGLWRSVDGGHSWEPSNVGYTPRGSSGIAIDPHFPHRLLSAGSNSMGSEFNGLYLSEDRAASWRPVLRVPISGVEDRRAKLAFDPTTRDDDAGYTAVAYWSRTAEHKKDNWGPREINPGLYRSDDGGQTWARLNDAASAVAGHSAIAVHPETGRLFAANARGVFISDDRGETFRPTSDAAATGLTLSAAAPDVVFATTADGLLRSTDAGETFTPLPTRGLDEPIADERGRDARPGSPRRNVVFGAPAVSPADPDRLIMRSLADDWRWLRHVSHDGGQTWNTAQVNDALAFFPQNSRQAMFAWHPTDPDVVFSYGGDWPTVSTDGGRTFHWTGRGQHAVYIGSPFAFNPHHPGLLFLASQDYNGGVTHDAGETWTYTNVSGHGWGGFVYGGLALAPEVLAGGHAEGGWGNDRLLRVSRDGGGAWSEQPGVAWSARRDRPNFANDVGLVHPDRPHTAFIARFRTDDHGKTWSEMSGVTGVFAADARGRLYGIQQQGEPHADLVRSDDAGLTWQPFHRVDAVVDDLAVTPDAATVYYAAKGRLWQWTADPATATRLETPPTGTGVHRVATVAVDPLHPGRLYAGQRIDTHAADVGVLRSDDHGATWTNLNRTAPLDPDRRDPAGLDGGREPQFLRVDPHTGTLWVTTGCYGVWTYGPSEDLR